jgi:hypothetical protein
MSSAQHQIEAEIGKKLKECPGFPDGESKPNGRDLELVVDESRFAYQIALPCDGGWKAFFQCNDGRVVEVNNDGILEKGNGWDR